MAAKRSDEHAYRSAERAVWQSHGVESTDRWCRLDRLRTEVRVQELGDGPAVLFLHGASGAGTSWAGLAARLAGFRRVLIDRPGCGLSPPLGRRLDDMARLDEFADQFVLDVLDALDLPSAHVVATSFGGYFGLRAAAAQPDRIDKLVVLGWTFGAPAASTPLIMRLAMQPALGRLVTRVRPNERMVRKLLAQIGLRRAVETGRLSDTEVAWFLSLLRDTDTMRNELDAAPPVLTLRGINADTLLHADLLAGIAAPALFLWGDEDPMGDAAVARDFVAMVPNATLELIRGAGHSPWIDDLDHVAATVGGFLQETATAPDGSPP